MHVDHDLSRENIDEFAVQKSNHAEVIGQR
jgi:hypothetical protein